MSELEKALVAAQAEMPAVRDNATAEVPTKSGGKYSYHYVTLDHLIATTRPVLAKHGLAIVQFPAMEDQGPVLRTIVVHESGETLNAGNTPLLVGEKSMQQLGSAISYARRYAWMSVLGISADEDDDGESASRPSEKHSAEKPSMEQLMVYDALAASYEKMDTTFNRGAGMEAVRDGDADYCLRNIDWLKDQIARVQADMEAQTALEGLGAAT